MNEFVGVWNQVKNRLRERISPDSFNRWIAGIVPLDLDGSICKLGISNDFFADWLRNSYVDWIVEALEEVTGINGIEIQFEVGHDVFEDQPNLEAKPAAAKPKKKKAEPKKKAESKESSVKQISVLNPHYLFDTFVVGDSNKFCHAACMAVAGDPGKQYNPLFIHGGVGLGKTHVAQAIAHDVLEKNPQARVECLSSEEFLNIYVDAMSQGKSASFRRHFRNLDLLVIDDVQFLKGKEKFQEEFFHTFNTLFNAHKQIVLTSDKSPQELDGLEGRLVSRFEWGLSTEVCVPDLETRAAILKQKQDSLKIRVPNDVIFYIAERIKANVRRLEGALMKLVSYVSLTHEPINRELAERLLGAIFEEEVSSEVTVDKIIKSTADQFDLRVSDITGKKRLASIVGPRQVAMFLARKLTKLSTPEIGEHFGRNHATILHAVQKVEKEISKDEKYRLAVNKLERQLKMG